MKLALRTAVSVLACALAGGAAFAAGVRIDAASVSAAPSAGLSASAATVQPLPASAAPSLAAVAAAPLLMASPAAAPLPLAAAVPAISAAVPANAVPAAAAAPVGAPARVEPARAAAHPEAPGAKDHAEEALGALYDGGAARRANDEGAPAAGAASRQSPRLAPAGPPGERAATPEVAPPPVRRSALSRFPLSRGEIGWAKAWALVNPGSPLNSLPARFKSDSMRERESRMWEHNVAYVFGFRPETFQDAENRARREERIRVRDERSAKIRSAYALPPFESLTLRRAALGRKIGSGGQGDAYEAAGDPRRVVKVFRDATPAQLQEYAALVNAVADKGAPVARVSVVRLSDGRHGLEMPHYSSEEGWTSLQSYAAFHSGNEVRSAEARAGDAIRAVMRESQRVAGVELGDWKQGLGGGDGDDYLDNFAYRPKTGEVMCFDCVVMW